MDTPHSTANRGRAAQNTVADAGGDPQVELAANRVKGLRMARQTHAARIVALLRRRPGLDDDEISQLAGVRPRQQVNEICRRLEHRGMLKRSVGPRGKIVNELVVNTWCLPAQSDLSDTLLIVPCSKAKATATATSFENGQDEHPAPQVTGPRVGSELPASLAERLDGARAANRERAAMDERTLVPAWQRYSGNFYRAAGDALAEAVERGLHVLILSGGYGVLLAREPIGLYEAVLKPSRWPERVLEDVLVGYARRHGLKRMRAFVARTTSYRKIVERTDWKKAGVEDAVLLMPARKALGEFDSPGGASRVSQNLIVRAQGEAFAALLGGIALAWTWRSEAELALRCRKLV